jgi:hypothetical protein
MAGVADAQPARRRGSAGCGHDTAVSCAALVAAGGSGQAGLPYRGSWTNGWLDPILSLSPLALTLTKPAVLRLKTVAATNGHRTI